MFEYSRQAFHTISPSWFSGMWVRTVHLANLRGQQLSSGIGDIISPLKQEF